MANTNYSTIKNASDEKLIKRFYSFSKRYLIVNLITTALFLITLILLFSESYAEALVTVLLSSIFIAVCSNVNTTYNRNNIDQEMSERYSEQYGSGYNCIVQRSKELYGKSLSLSSGDGVMLKIAKVLRIVNYIFYVVSALAFVALSVPILAIGVIVYIFGTFLPAFFGGHGGGFAAFLIDLSGYSKIPWKIATKHLSNAFRSIFDEPANRDYSEAFTVTDNSNDEHYAKLHLAEFVTSQCFDNVSLPSNTHWENAGHPYVEVLYDTAYIKGTLICDALCYKHESDVDKAIDTLYDNMKPIADKKYGEFLAAYPAAKNAKIEIEIIGKIE